MTPTRDRHHPAQHTADAAGGVKGVFRDRDLVERAVRRLAENSVPANQIRVHVVDAARDVVREVPVEDEAGTLRGAGVGALVGAVVGVALVGLAFSGILGTRVDLFELATWRGAVRAVLLAAAAGVPLGALLSIGHWRGGDRIDIEDLDKGFVVVQVTSAARVDIARRVLEEAGAEQIADLP
jgi:hypothetical protein